KKAFFKTVRKEYGDPLVIDSEDGFHEFTDNFVYSYRFPDNSTVIDRFVFETSDLSEKEKAIVLKWKDPVVGLFQVKRTLPDGFVAENLINEVDYTIKPTTIPQRLKELATPGVFFRAKIIPASDSEYIFSGVQEFLDISEKEILKRVAQLQMKNPQFAFRDNEEKIRQGFELQKEDRDVFIEYFGSDEVLTEGRKLPAVADEFMNYRLSKREKPLPEGYKPPEMSFPEGLLKSKDVGIVFDELSGQHYLVNYGLMVNIFQNPDESRIERYRKDILIYLEDQTISPHVLKRLFFRFSQNTEFVIRKILDRPEFDLEKDFDSLIDEFKPSFKGKRIYPYILPMSTKFVEAMKPELYQKKKNQPKIGRNDPCPCGSGKKYKKCCGR
ncbi:MAG: SEC-C metal-binding domain-containing protein, partial [Candidatus Aminicenantes bacterium]|nr:SEC-C metal-binding domain-containing protein [Candidatus Aminicenantes bacterium]